jgi:DNA replicative helicase MCM subunit Mcm2 (Cdc46/Mcm family)
MKNNPEVSETAQQVLDTFDLLVPLLEQIDRDDDEELSEKVDEALDDIGRCRLLLKRLL